MIVQAIVDFIFLPLNLLINMLPSALVENIAIIQLPDIVRMGVCFFPLDVITITVGMFAAWYGIFLTWAIIEWVYKKIPGVS